MVRVVTVSTTMRRVSGRRLHAFHDRRRPRCVAQVDA